MKNIATCAQCNSEISALKIGIQWPTKITCKTCGARHYYRFGNLLGGIYLVLLLVSVVFIIGLSDQFANAQNGIYSTSPLQLIVKFGGMALAFVAVSYAFGVFLTRFSTLHERLKK